MDYFEVFGLPRRLAIDGEALQRQYYELARRYHPDRYQAASAPEQERAQQMSALVNAAYRALRDPIARIEYLVRLEEGRTTREGAVVKPKAPPELLTEMFEIQEALQEAKAGGLDEPRRAELAAQRTGLQERHRREEDRLRGPLTERWDAAVPAERPAAVRAFKESLATRAYLQTVIEDLAVALEEGQEPYVTHHRY